MVTVDRSAAEPSVVPVSPAGTASAPGTANSANPVLSLSTEPELVLLSPDARTRRFDRDDVVVRKGEIALINGHFTPHESMVRDLLAIAHALDAAGIDFLLVRGDHDRPVLAVDRKRRKHITRALAEAFSNDPFYAKPLDGHLTQPLLLADGALTTLRKSSVFRVYRPRIEPIGRLRYGAETAFQFELWFFGEDEIVAPVENSLMRKRMPRGEARETTITLYGRTWRTLQHMFDDLASDVSFDIDMVFSWVDGSSSDFQRERAKRMKAYVVGSGDESDARFRQIDELKYALRSVYMFAPWVRRIFIATDSPAPEWLAEHPRVTIMNSEDFFPDPSVLPTHNSHAVESQLHHIPGLAEHFLYSNDDMFFGRPVGPELFFSPGGVTKFIEASTRIGLGENDPSRSGFENAARVNRALLRERFGKVTTRHLEHTAVPMRKSVLLELEAEFPEDFARTAASQFRSATDISVTNSLYHYYALTTGRAVEQTQARSLYIETTLKLALRQMNKLRKRRDQDMFCLNDGSFPEISDEVRRAAVTEFLEQYFPIVAPWEREAQATASGTPAATDSVSPGAEFARFGREGQSHRRISAESGELAGAAVAIALGQAPRPA
ncbi:sugar phosphotransferase [Cryobacterium sp. MDB1-18-2]|uniref:stealth family protein n=1 Tax=unclassified Cryobacterium TaxID=2649013 RepID=UPI00106D1A19|nr:MULTISPECIES: stealth family protein [unclassified Cryobacterium]TFC26740.1 sugar phosphotransferase [Cryobacterium sp. MDB1-18-2]TFC46494.1 sugar phosphotransferase [Cryobacterium sp. MDB1-18-1]